jgi:hypothetical protein
MEFDEKLFSSRFLIIHDLLEASSMTKAETMGFILPLQNFSFCLNDHISGIGLDLVHSNFKSLFFSSKYSESIWRQHKFGFMISTFSGTMMTRSACLLTPFYRFWNVSICSVRCFF